MYGRTCMGTNAWAHMFPGYSDVADMETHKGSMNVHRKGALKQVNAYMYVKCTYIHMQPTLSQISTRYMPAH
jgi:hypothetical protein